MELTPNGRDLRREPSAAARTNLRLPVHLKARAEAAANRDGLSLNAWLVRAVAAAVDAEPQPHDPTPCPTTGQRVRGWVR